MSCIPLQTSDQLLEHSIYVQVACVELQSFCLQFKHADIQTAGTIYGNMDVPTGFTFACLCVCPVYCTKALLFDVIIYYVCHQINCGTCRN